MNRSLIPSVFGKLYFAPLKAQEHFTYLQMSILAKPFWNVRIPLMTTWKKCKLSSLFHVEVEFKNFVACILTPKYLHINLFIAERGWLNSSYGLVPANIFDFPVPLIYYIGHRELESMDMVNIFFVLQWQRCHHDKIKGKAKYIWLQLHPKFPRKKRQ